MIFEHAKWISPEKTVNCPVFFREFELSGNVKSAFLYITANGVYKAEINGNRAGDFIMAPGWTKYEVRHQYQKYDITPFLKQENKISAVLGNGWQRGRISGYKPGITVFPKPCIIAQIIIEYENNTVLKIPSDIRWKCGEGPVLRSDIYDGEAYDARKNLQNLHGVKELALDKSNLIPQEGETVCEHERIKPVAIITTPKNETVIDFGQNITGYPEIALSAESGDTVSLSFGEILDKDGNFYNQNYRSAKCEYTYICRDGFQTYKPQLTFYGFRYIRIDSFPVMVTADSFTAIAIYSDIKQTGFIESSNKALNKLFSNVLWGQKDNFLDIPTDCPQRDERHGWTGDSQVFVKTACYNFDVEKFFKKWLRDLRAEQGDDGFVPHIVPKTRYAENHTSAAWGDACVIVPWNIYRAYGDKDFLAEQYPSMCKWIFYISKITTQKYLWLGGTHFGDWLAVDAPYGSYKGASRDDFIATAFYAYSTQLVIKAGKALDKDTSYYEDLLKNIKSAFSEHFSECLTQTECALALRFGLSADPAKTVAKLANMIKENGCKLTTGFVGTPYLLHALSENGFSELAYTLLLSDEKPSWLYSVKMGATTVWEHWDGIDENGKMWSSDMNSFNHYAYGSVFDWVYSVAAGINTSEDFPGYKKVVIKPIPDKRLSFLSARLKTRHGNIVSEWRYDGNFIHYNIITPVEATVEINSKKHMLAPGNYRFKEQL